MPFLNLQKILSASRLSSQIGRIQAPPPVWIQDSGWGLARTWRWVFLGLIQDPVEHWHCWRRCSACIKLHPVNMFTSRKEMKCIADARGGIVYLCPCICLTFHDTQRLISQLDWRSYSDQNPEGEGEIEPWHKCEKSYGSTRVQVQIRPVPLEDGGLLVETKYDITCENLGSPLRGLPYFCCPHTSINSLVLDDSVRQMMRDTCIHCSSSATYSLFSEDGMCRYSIRTLRNLGSRRSEAEDTWSKQQSPLYKSPDTFRRPLPRSLKHPDLMDSAI